MTHTAHYHAHDETVGEGNVYQGRYKSFPIEIEKLVRQKNLLCPKFGNLFDHPLLGHDALSSAWGQADLL